MKLGTPKIPVKPTKKNILKYILKCKKILDEQRVPKKGRKVAYWDGTQAVWIKT